METLVAPIALYPDSLLAQVLAAATYPLEVVQANRWAKSNKSLKSDALATALNQQTWDPSVKSLVNFPQVLEMMDQNLSWTQQLGDAFLAQEKDVMEAVQRLRAKAQSQGNLKTTEQQTVTTQPGTNYIVVQPSNPEVVYVPTYNPTVVYGGWPYPYTPYAYYPPGYVAGTAALSFATGVALGAAWGYAWNGCNWNGGDVDVNVNRNANFNNKIDRSSYASRYERGGGGATGRWQHDSAHRQGVPYRDQGTASRYNRSASTPGSASRQAYRGRTAGTTGYTSRGTAGGARTPSATTRPSATQASRGTSTSGGAFSGVSSGSQARTYSSRGSASRSSSYGGGGRSGGGSFGGGRSGGGGRGGGGRGGGGRR